jgi:penicillin amidase
MRKFGLIVSRIVLVLLVLVLLLGLGGYWWLRGSLSQTAGTLSVVGIDNPIEIVRDEDGVPHIYANTESEALFGLGYVHAQDRLWQMEFQRRVGHGRLSEILGDATLETDKFLRTLGVSRAAEQAWQHATPTEVKVLTYYVAGVNAFISEHKGRQLPIEFTILGVEPEPWTPQDTLVWAKMMSWDLGSNWGDELLRTKLTAHLGAERTNELMMPYSPNDPIILPPSAPIPDGPALSSAETNYLSDTKAIDQLLAINQTIQLSLGLGGKAIGSNNWVVGGAHTTTGKPLLANDPHLGAQIPSIWYLAHLNGGRLNAIGSTLPGMPGIVIGHNQDIAWGITNTTPDVQDLFVERINEQNQIEYKGQWQDLQIVEETIKVKGQPDVVLPVRIGPHGPIISDVLDDSSDHLAFRWTALDEEDHIVEAFNGIARARNWQQFTNALARYSAPMQNFVFADWDNNIGYYAPGRLPIRAKGDGMAPVPGWTGEYDWLGYVPFDQLPHSHNPEEGMIVTANNRVTPDAYPYVVGNSYAAPYRAQRILQLLQSKDKLSPQDMIDTQLDVVSLQALEILPHLLKVQPTTQHEHTALDLLAKWDGSMRGDSAAAAVYQGWYELITENIFSDELGPELWKDYAGEKDFMAMRMAELLQGRGYNWCDDINTPATETCEEQIAKSLAPGLARMASYQKTPQPQNWRWDRVHHAQFPHQPFGEVDAIKGIFNRSIPTSGDGFTVNVAPYRRTALYHQYHIASYRQVINLINLEESYYINSTGQSGQLLDAHYSDMIEKWQQGQYIPMRYDKNAINASTTSRLVLEPKK